MRLLPVARVLSLILGLVALVAELATPASRAAVLAQVPARVAVLHAAALGGPAPVTVAATIGGVDTLLISGLSSGQRLPYQDLPAGTYPVKLFAGTLTQQELAGAMPLLTADVTLAPARDQTVVALGGANGFPLALLVLSDSPAPPSAGQASVRVVHAAPFAAGAAATGVDVVREDGQAIPGLLNLEFGEAPEPVLLPAGVSLDLKIVPTGQPAAEPLINLPPRSLAVGEELILVAAGGAGGQPLQLIELPRERRAPVQLRVLHLAPFASGTAPVDILVAGERVVERLPYLGQSDELRLEEGSYTVALTQPGEATPLTSGELELLRGRSYVAAAIGGASGVPLQILLLDDPGAPPPGGALLRVVHAAPFAAGAAALLDLREERNNALFKGLRDLPLGSESLVPLASGVYRLRFTLPGGGGRFIPAPDLVLSAGNVAALYVVGDGVNQPLRPLVLPADLNARMFLPLIQR